MRPLALLLLLALATAAASAAPASAVTAPAEVGALVLATGDVSPDTTVIDVSIDSTGTATWRVEYRVALDDEATEDAFFDLKQDVEESPESYLGEFAAGINATVDAAARDTGREMEAGSFSLETETRSLPSRYGIVRYSFEWTGFGVVEGDTLTALDGIDGFFLDEGSTLIVSWPRKMEVSSVTPAPSDQRDTSVVWEGPLSFASGEPRLGLVETGETEADDGTSAVYLLVGLALLLAVAAAYLYVRSHDQDAEEAVEEEELLSNEERVVRFLRDSEGRVKQQDVVEEFDWTEAKTSQVVAKLKEDDQVEVFRLGRENVLKLADQGGDET